MTLIFNIHTVSGGYIICTRDFKNYLWKDGTVHIVSFTLQHDYYDRFKQGWWHYRDFAERDLNKYNRKQEKQMSVERLEQVKKDIRLLQVEQAKIEKKIEDEKYIFKAGDVVKNKYGMVRVIVNITSVLKAFSKSGEFQGSGQVHFNDFKYKKIGTIADFTN